MPRSIAEIADAASRDEKVTRDEAVAVIQAIPRTCRGARSDEGHKIVKTLLEEGRLEDAQRADQAHRTMCGQDINAVIVKMPFDGEEYAINCPKCGLEISLRTPRFNLVEDEQPSAQ